jgi:hypothetical protein
MQSKLFFKQVLISVCLLSLSLSACLLVQAGIVSTEIPLSLPTESLSTAIPSPSVPSLPTGMIEVAFVKDGNIQVWDEATQQTRTIVDTGDVFSVTVSDDGQIIAFTRGSWVGDVLDGYEQFALWAMNRDGGNPRELISAQDLRQRINPSERESSNFYQLSWVPQSHQLIFSGTKYIVQAEGLSHAIPQGAYLVDTDKGSVTVLAEAAENLRFLPSPDGKQIALMSPSDVGFINADGSNRRQDVLTYAEVGLTGPLFPMGVWTQDSRAFVMTGSFERDPSFDVNFTIWRIPIDGSSPEALATVTGSHPNSVTFSPDGKSVSFLQRQISSHQKSLDGSSNRSSLKRVHWHFHTTVRNLLCQSALVACRRCICNQRSGSPPALPDATQDSQVCGEPIHLGSGIITALQWVDTSRFLFESIEPNTLSLGNLDGTITPIVTWTEGQRWTENDCAYQAGAFINPR